MTSYSNHHSRSNYTLLEQNQNRRKFAQALQSGDHEPLVVERRFNPDGISPAALACEVSGLFGNDDWTEQALPSLPTNVQDWLGLRTPAGEFNGPEGPKNLLGIGQHDLNLTFDDIAIMLLTEPEGLVIREESLATWKWEQAQEGLWTINAGPEQDRSARYTIRDLGNGTFETTVITQTTTTHQTLSQAAKTAHLHAQRRHRYRTRHILGDQEAIT